MSSTPERLVEILDVTDGLGRVLLEAVMAFLALIQQIQDAILTT